MTSSELKSKEIASRKEIADADRAQREKSEKRGQAAKFIGDGIKTIGSIASKFNDPSFYKKLVGSALSDLNISTFLKRNVEDRVLSQDGPSGIGRDLVAAPAVTSILYAPTIGSTNYADASLTVEKDNIGGGINAALNRVATQLEKRNSRVISYSRDTIGRYLFIATDIAVDLVKIKVAIEVYDMADSLYPDLSRSIIYGLGFNYANFKASVANIKTEYVRLVASFNAGITLPKELTYVARQLWLSTHILRDHKGSKAAYIVFCKAIQFEFGNQVGLEDVYISDGIPANGINAVTLCDSIDIRINKIVNGATWRPLLRDLRGGMNESDFIQLDPALDHKLHVISDVSEVMEQFHNMEILPQVWSTNPAAKRGLVLDSFTVYGNAAEEVRQGVRMSNSMNAGNNTTFTVDWRDTPGLLILGQSNNSAVTVTPTYSFCKSFGFIPDLSAHESVMSSFSKLNYYHEKVTDDDLLTATRFKPVFGFEHSLLFGKGTSTGTTGMTVKTEEGVYTVSNTTVNLDVILPYSCGTELVLGIKPITAFPSASVSFKYKTAFMSYIDVVSVNMANVDNIVLSNYYVLMDAPGAAEMYYFVNALSYAQQLDWYPLTAVITTPDDDGYTCYRVIGEIDNYFYIDGNLMSRINRQCVESEWTIKSIDFLKPLQ